MYEFSLLIAKGKGQTTVIFTPLLLFAPITNLRYSFPLPSGLFDNELQDMKISGQIFHPMQTMIHLKRFYIHTLVAESEKLMTLNKYFIS